MSTSISLSEQQIQLVLAGMIGAAQQAGALMSESVLLRRSGDGALGTVTKSSPSDFVTQVDIKCDELIMERLRRTAAEAKLEAAFLTEETSPDTPVTSGPLFVVDPIDGTTSFMHGMQCCCVSIAFCVDAEPVVGVVFAALVGELYTAVRGRGAFLNGAPIRKRGSNPTKISDALISYHLPANRQPWKIDTSLAIVRDLLESSCHSVRCMGSAAVDLCNVAVGRVDSYLELAISAWDIAAGVLIAREAGCTVYALEDSDEPQPFRKLRNAKLGVVAAASEELGRAVYRVALKHGLTPAKYLRSKM